MPTVKRRRASAIVQHPQGIVLVLMRHMGAMLPGGGVHPQESEHDAALRELWEETGLVAQHAQFLFHTQSLAHINTIFWVHAPGQPLPCNEIDQIAYYPNSVLRLTPETHIILRRFREIQANEPERFVVA